jgi:uncharacterized membrane protein YkvA (DUF1232 family)
LTEGDIQRAERFYTKLRTRILDWLQRNTQVNARIRNYLLLLPDLFVLVIRLIRDPRIENGYKWRLFAGLAYVISPIDLVPDFLLPIGYVDDTVALAFTLIGLVRIMGQAGEEVMQEHWEGDGSILYHIENVVETAEVVLNNRIVQRLSRQFGHRRNRGL